MTKKEIELVNSITDQDELVGRAINAFDYGNFELALSFYEKALPSQEDYDIV